MQQKSVLAVLSDKLSTLCAQQKTTLSSKHSTAIKKIRKLAYIQNEFLQTIISFQDKKDQQQAEKIISAFQNFTIDESFLDENKIISKEQMQDFLKQFKKFIKQCYKSFHPDRVQGDDKKFATVISKSINNLSEIHNKTLEELEKNKTELNFSDLNFKEQKIPEPEAEFSSQQKENIKKFISESFAVVSDFPITINNLYDGYNNYIKVNTFLPQHNLGLFFSFLQRLLANNNLDNSNKYSEMLDKYKNKLASATIYGSNTTKLYKLKNDLILPKDLINVLLEKFNSETDFLKQSALEFKILMTSCQQLSNIFKEEGYSVLIQNTLPHDYVSATITKTAKQGLGIEIKIDSKIDVQEILQLVAQNLTIEQESILNINGPFASFGIKSLFIPLEVLKENKKLTLSNNSAKININDQVNVVIAHLEVENYQRAEQLINDINVDQLSSKHVYKVLTCSINNTELFDTILDKFSTKIDSNDQCKLFAQVIEKGNITQICKIYDSFKPAATFKYEKMDTTPGYWFVRRFFNLAKDLIHHKHGYIFNQSDYIKKIKLSDFESIEEFGAKLVESKNILAKLIELYPELLNLKDYKNRTLLEYSEQNSIKKLLEQLLKDINPGQESKISTGKLTSNSEKESAPSSAGKVTQDSQAKVSDKKAVTGESDETDKPKQQSDTANKKTYGKTIAVLLMGLLLAGAAATSLALLGIGLIITAAVAAAGLVFAGVASLITFKLTNQNKNIKLENEQDSDNRTARTANSKEKALGDKAGSSRPVNKKTLEDKLTNQNMNIKLENEQGSDNNTARTASSMEKALGDKAGSSKPVNKKTLEAKLTNQNKNIKLENEQGSDNRTARTANSKEKALGDKAGSSKPVNKKTLEAKLTNQNKNIKLENEQDSDNKTARTASSKEEGLGDKAGSSKPVNKKTLEAKLTNQNKNIKLENEQGSDNRTARTANSKEKALGDKAGSYRPVNKKTLEDKLTNQNKNIKLENEQGSDNNTARTASSKEEALGEKAGSSKQVNQKTLEDKLTHESKKKTEKDQEKKQKQDTSLPLGSDNKNLLINKDNPKLVKLKKSKPRLDKQAMERKIRDNFYKIQTSDDEFVKDMLKDLPEQNRKICVDHIDKLVQLREKANAKFDSIKSKSVFCQIASTTDVQLISSDRKLSLLSTLGKYKSGKPQLAQKAIEDFIRNMSPNELLELHQKNPEFFKKHASIPFEKLNPLFKMKKREYDNKIKFEFKSKFN